MTERLAHAKINLALVVGPVGAERQARGHDRPPAGRARRPDRARAGGRSSRVEGFEDDTLVRGALEALAGAAGVEPALGASGSRRRSRSPRGSAAGARTPPPRSRSRTRRSTEPLPPERLHELAARLGADVPVLPRARARSSARATARGLTPLELPQALHRRSCVIPDGAAKESTASVYAAFDERDGADGYEERRAPLLAALAAGDLAALPPNDLASLAARRTSSRARRVPRRRQRRRPGRLRRSSTTEAAAAEAAATASSAHGRVWIGPASVVGCARERDGSRATAKSTGGRLYARRLKIALGIAVARGDHRRGREGLLRAGR